MSERMYTDDDVAQLYTLLNAWGASDAFYLPWVMAANAVLDVGCGPGALLHRARAEGHGGRLVGVDPDPAALALARRRDDIEWVAGVAAEMSWNAAFDLAVMTGHAFQCLISDDDMRDSLAAIRRALRDGGAFVFETRNPTARAWESWSADPPIELADHTGRSVRVTYDILAVEADVVTVTETTATTEGDVLRVDRAQLRFVTVERLDAALQAAGFVIEERYGDWTGGAWQPDSAEIITVARRGRARAKPFWQLPWKPFRRRSADR